jgi:hypothetical protein
VDALPLSTSEYAVTRNRLANTHRYLQAGEHGAARYELLLIRGDMSR